MATTSIRQAVTLSASTTVTADSTGTTAVRLNPLGDVQAITFVMDVTDADTNADDTLDVFVQTKCDGTSWVDVVAFTQVLGNGTDTKRFFAKITNGGSQAMFENATALAAGSVRNLFGEEWRCRWDYTDGGGAGDAQFVFSVVAVPS